MISQESLPHSTKNTCNSTPIESCTPLFPFLMALREAVQAEIAFEFASREEGEDEDGYTCSAREDLKAADAAWKALEFPDAS